MLYSIIDTKKGEAHGLKPALHNLIGDKMVVNENELRRISDDIYEAARTLGGEVMPEGVVVGEMKRNRQNKDRQNKDRQ